MIFLWITLGVAVYLAVGAVLGRLFARWDCAVSRRRGYTYETARNDAQTTGWLVLAGWPLFAPFAASVIACLDVQARGVKPPDWHPIDRVSAWLVRGIPEDTR